jgi:hypothetical protein
LKVLLQCIKIIIAVVVEYVLLAFSLLTVINESFDADIENCVRGVCNHK